MPIRLSRLCRFLAATPILLSAAAVAAPVAAPQPASGSAMVLGSLSVAKRADLDFGALIVNGAGTAIINPVARTLSTTGGVAAFGTAARPAVFTGTGSRNSVVLIRIPRDPITLTRTGGTETVTVSSWTLDGDKNRKIPLGNAFDFAVGATLTIAAGQADGTYVGSFDVTVQYP